MRAVQAVLAAAASGRLHTGPPVHRRCTANALRCGLTHRPPALHPPAAAAPTFLRCTISAKKVGLKAYGASAPRLEACAIERCGEQGLRAQESAAPALQG